MYLKKNEKFWCNHNNFYPVNDQQVKRFISVVPSQRQLKFLDMEYYNFIHFGINTINGAEWGKGDEDISLFDPAGLDTDQWCRVLKKTGSKGIIITAKHHDGFCLFDTKLTDHNVMNTPYGKDIVASLSQSCRKYGLKLGIYLSPWDRHEKSYGTPEYNDFFVGQLTELCENYGEIFCFWFDGACGEGANGKKQVYDWDRYYAVIREHHPDAVISVCGPDVRWIGNEGGKVRKSEWSIIPASTQSNEKIAEGSQQNENEGEKLAAAGDMDEDLGSRERISKYRDLCFKPAEADVSVNLGWFWHDDRYYRFKRNRTAKQLAKIYFNSVGGNASLLLNVPPNKNGLIDEREIRTLEEFTRLITEPLKTKIDIKETHSVTVDGKKREKCELCLADDEGALAFTLPEKARITAVKIKEDLRSSQRVEQFELYSRHEKGYKLFYRGTVIGSGKIALPKKKVITDEVLLVVTQSRSNPVIRSVEIYGECQ